MNEQTKIVIERKLIRDKMGRTIGLGPGDNVRLVKNDDEFETLLLEKLQEEYLELRKELVKKNGDCGKILEEACDVLEVLGSIVNHFASCDLQLLIDEARKKRQARGTFEAGVVLERTV